MDAFQTQQWHFCTLTYHLESRESEAGRLLWCMFHPELHVEFKAYLNYREKSHHTHTQRNEWMGIKFTLLSDEFYMDTLIDCIEMILYWETALVLLMIRSTTTLWNVCVSHFTSVMEYNKWLFCKRIYQQRFKMLGKKVKFSSVLKMSQIERERVDSLGRKYVLAPKTWVKNDTDQIK